MAPSLSLNWHDFLARAPLVDRAVDASAVVARQPVLILGAGGSIGSALALRLALCPGANLILVDSSESHLAALESALFSSMAVCERRLILGSAGNEALLEEIFTQHAPHTVFHAAAYKQVPLLESQPLAAIENNILVTQAVAAACMRHRAEMIFLSTDKVVEPRSILGVTKRVAELIALCYGGAALRLGNVLGSRDSVSETFAAQIAAGGPITVTDPEARRLFLTVEEAVYLLVSVAALAQGHTLFAPDLHISHSVTDLALFMAERLSPDKPIPIRFTALRAGEKLSEALWSQSEVATSVRGNGGLVRIETHEPDPPHIDAALDDLRAAWVARDVAGALSVLRSIVPDYTPGETVLALQSGRVTQ